MSLTCGLLPNVATEDFKKLRNSTGRDRRAIDRSLSVIIFFR